MVLGHMAIIPFPVLFAWYSVKKRVKTTKIKDNKIIKNLKNQTLFILWLIFTKSNKEVSEAKIDMGDAGEPPAGARISRGP